MSSDVIEVKADLSVIEQRLLEREHEILTAETKIAEVRRKLARMKTRIDTLANEQIDRTKPCPIE